MTIMYAFLSNQGTAMGETAICASCRDHPGKLDTARDNAREASDWDGNNEPTECTLNEALECQFCGAPGHAKKLWQVSVPVHVYFEVMAESEDEILEMSEDTLEDAYFSGGGSKYAEVDMRTANFATVTVYDPVEGQEV